MLVNKLVVSGMSLMQCNPDRKDRDTTRVAISFIYWVHFTPPETNLRPGIIASKIHLPSLFKLYKNDRHNPVFPRRRLAMANVGAQNVFTGAAATAARGLNPWITLPSSKVYIPSRCCREVSELPPRSEEVTGYWGRYHCCWISVSDSMSVLTLLDVFGVTPNHGLRRGATGLQLVESLFMQHLRGLEVETQLHQCSCASVGRLQRCH